MEKHVLKDYKGRYYMSLCVAFIFFIGYLIAIAFICNLNMRNLDLLKDNHDLQQQKIISLQTIEKLEAQLKDKDK